MKSGTHAWKRVDDRTHEWSWRRRKGSRGKKNGKGREGGRCRLYYLHTWIIDIERGEREGSWEIAKEGKDWYLPLSWLDSRPCIAVNMDERWNPTWPDFQFEEAEITFDLSQ